MASSSTSLKKSKKVTEEVINLGSSGEDEDEEPTNWERRQMSREAASSAEESVEVPMATQRIPADVVGAEEAAETEVVDDYQEEANSFLNQSADEVRLSEDVLLLDGHEFNEIPAETPFDFFLVVVEQELQLAPAAVDGREEQNFFVEVGGEGEGYVNVDDLLESVDLDGSVVVLQPIPYHDGGLLVIEEAPQLANEAEVVFDLGDENVEELIEEEEELVEEQEPEIQEIVEGEKENVEMTDEIGHGEEDSDEDSYIDVEMNSSEDEEKEMERKPQTREYLKEMDQPLEDVVVRSLFTCLFKNCLASYKTFEELQEHMEIHPNLQEFSCDVCKTNFPSKDAAMAHIQEREKKECCGCGRRCRHAGEMVQHLRSHTGEKPFVCTTCGQRFSQLNILKNHWLTHTGEKPFQCRYCDYGTGRKADLMRHSRVHSGDKPYPCGECEKRFAEKGTLKSHELTHKGEKPFSCGHCERRFKDRSTLKRHVTNMHVFSHNGGKAFECKECGRSFSRKTHLNRHTFLLHSGRNVYSCENCDATFAKKDHFQNHMRSKHQS